MTTTSVPSLKCGWAALGAALLVASCGGRPPLGQTDGGRTGDQSGCRDGDVATITGTITPSSHDFGRVAVGGPSAAQIFTVGLGGLQGALRVESSPSEEFRLEDNGCSAALAGLKTCTVTVRFVPGGQGQRQGALQVTVGASKLSTPLVG